MKSSKLKVGDRVRITCLPKGGPVPEITIKACNKLIKRGRSLRVAYIDEYGIPWVNFRFRMKNGKWEYHMMAIYEEDENWISVKKRK